MTSQPAPRTGAERRGLQHPGRWLWLFLLVPIALGLARLRFDVEVLNLLPDHLPEVHGLKLYQENFANARELVVTVRGPDADSAENAARLLAEQTRRETGLVASATWQLPLLEHPDQSAELIAYLWFNQPPPVFQSLADRLAPGQLARILSETREQLASSLSPGEIARLSYDPFGLTRLPDDIAGAAPGFDQAQDFFASREGTFRIVFVQARQELRTYRECAAWLQAIRQSIATVLPASDLASSRVRLGFTGRPAFVTEIAGGMERDITASVGGTSVIIAGLFWLAHRRVKPMLWLLTLLALILASTLALGGLIFGRINVVSMGFAAILLGLAVDYAVVHYQEALAHPALSIPEIRRAIAPSIFWAAVTTISAFLVLNFGGLPGLAQLGTLVGLGVGLAACIMIFEFLPPLFPDRRQPKAPPTGALLGRGGEASRPDPLPHALPGTAAESPAPSVTAPAVPPWRARCVGTVTFLLLAGSAIVLWFGLPRLDPTADALRPRQSPAYAALEEIKVALSQQREPLWLILSGQTEREMARRLDEVQPALNHAVSNRVLAGFTLPTALWPRPEWQAANRPLASQLAAQQANLCRAAETGGFSDSALGLTRRILDTWQAASTAPGVFWPTNEMSRWLLGKLVARTSTNYLALGLLTPSSKFDNAVSGLSSLEKELPRRDVWLSGWELLGKAIFGSVQGNLWKLVLPMVSLVLLSLGLAFRRWPEIVLSLAVLALSGLCLLTVMRLAGWSWNLLNLMALPLVLGTGVDYSIFMQLALRRHRGNLRLAHQSVGRALLLCGATAMAGFGSLAWSSNAGMASLGQVCAVGIAGNMLISVLLLPVWWAGLTRRGDGPHSRSAAGRAPSASRPGLPSGPSSLYRSDIWRLGLAVVRSLPRGICVWISRWAADLYWALAPHRREVVIQNLLPALSGDQSAAREKARALFRQFAIKLVDLWRFESGLAAGPLFGTATGWEHLVQLKAERRGILILTPHLGNWEFGGALLTQRGIPLQVITLAEPGQDFTQLRQASRARWGIETLVIGDDLFAFVEVIRRLEAGATVALLVDRPRKPTAVKVELFGRPFAASIAAAELARASGCALLPVYIPHAGDQYEAHILEPIAYDRAALRDPKARQHLTQRIVSAFESPIRQHLDQWFHFVPVWPTEQELP